MGFDFFSYLKPVHALLEGDFQIWYCGPFDTCQRLPAADVVGPDVEVYWGGDREVGLVGYLPRDRGALPGFAKKLEQRLRLEPRYCIVELGKLE